MLTIFADELNPDFCTYYETGIKFLHGEELNGGTVLFFDPEDESAWFTDTESVALLGKAFKYHEGFFELSEYDEQILFDLLMASDTMDVYDNWKEGRVW